MTVCATSGTQCALQGPWDEAATHKNAPRGPCAYVGDSTAGNAMAPTTGCTCVSRYKAWRSCRPNRAQIVFAQIAPKSRRVARWDYVPKSRRASRAKQSLANSGPFGVTPRLDCRLWRTVWAPAGLFTSVPASARCGCRSPKPIPPPFLPLVPASSNEHGRALMLMNPRGVRTGSGGSAR